MSPLFRKLNQVHQKQQTAVFWVNNAKIQLKTYSDCQNIPLLQKICITESTALSEL